MQSWMSAYVRVTDQVSEWVGVAAMWLIFLMIGVLLLDAVTRNVIDYPLHWCVEVGQFALAAFYFMGGASTLKRDEHVRMDLIYARLSERARHWVDAVTVLCLIFYLGVMLNGSIASLLYAIETGERRFSMWNPSMIPIKALMAACLVLMLLQAISLLFKHVLALRSGAKA